MVLKEASERSLFDSHKRIDSSTGHKGLRIAFNKKMTGRLWPLIAQYCSG